MYNKLLLLKLSLQFLTEQLMKLKPELIPTLLNLLESKPKLTIKNKEEILLPVTEIKPPKTEPKNSLDGMPQLKLMKT